LVIICFGLNCVKVERQKRPPASVNTPRDGILTLGRRSRENPGLKEEVRTETSLFICEVSYGFEEAR